MVKKISIIVAVALFALIAKSSFPASIVSLNPQNPSVLIVPGHDKYSYGAQYRGVTEEIINRELGNYLLQFFENDSSFSASSVRDGSGAYAEWFTRYVAGEDIYSFRNNLFQIMNQLIQREAFIPRTRVQHNPAADSASLNLYGINKYANEYNIDAVVHLHFNDYPGRPYDLPGEYSGFAIYIPERQLPNYESSASLAQSIKSALQKIASPSNFPKEETVIIEDQELIAIGSNASREGASVLIEYSYIYESQIYSKALRGAYLKELAFQTYQGIKNYFSGEEPEEWQTTLLPYRSPRGEALRGWQNNLALSEQSLDILALQAALKKEGLYSCALTGYFGPCTKNAVTAFQQKYLDSSPGVVGPQTREKLNELYAF